MFDKFASFIAYWTTLTQIRGEGLLISKFRQHHNFHLIKFDARPNRDSISKAKILTIYLSWYRVNMESCTVVLTFNISLWRKAFIILCLFKYLFGGSFTRYNFLKGYICFFLYVFHVSVTSGSERVKEDKKYKTNWTYLRKLYDRNVLVHLINRDHFATVSRIKRLLTDNYFSNWQLHAVIAKVFTQVLWVRMAILEKTKSISRNKNKWKDKHFGRVHCVAEANEDGLCLGRIVKLFSLARKTCTRNTCRTWARGLHNSLYHTKALFYGFLGCLRRF